MPDKTSGPGPATTDFSHLAEAELRALDAQLAGQDSRRWDAFYQDRARPVPFFVTSPDESLAQWLAQGRLRPGRAIDLGCGNARNAICLARHGFTVEAVDYAPAAVAWARDGIAQAGAAVALVQADVFDLALAPGGYALVYDSGCFHHLAPHRRASYIDRVVRALQPGGWFGLTCFRPEGGSGLSDAAVYERGTLGGGPGYTEAQLRRLWSPGLQVQVLRPMVRPGADSGLFGEPFLWVMLAQKV